jgi:predicted phosphodiesterase
VGKGITGSCAFCNLPEDVRDVALAAWRRGQAYVSLQKLLGELGYALDLSQVQYCPCRSGHHDRGRPEEIAKKANDRLGKIADLLERSGIDPADIGKVSAVKLSEWSAFHKDDETGDAVITPMSGASIVLTPTWETGPQWQPIDRASKVPVALPKPSKRKTKTKTAVILPDVQFGYRRDIDTAVLDPFHDEQAISAALKVVQTVDPDLIIHLGDLLDFANFGKYEQEPGFALTVQPAIDRAHRYLAECAIASPNAKQVLLEGNHDRRLTRAIVNNAMAAFGLRRGNAPEEWPVLSIPYLLRLDELNVEYVGGYPAGIYWINDRLACIHGHKVKSSGSTAALVVDDERVSTIFGHVHRIELAYKTRRVRAGARTSLAASPGCLCRIDGTVPSVKGSYDPLGRPVPTVENWQQGCAIVTYQDGDSPFALELVPIFDGQVTFRGQVL